MSVRQRRSTKSDTLKKLDKLSDELDTAKDASEATTKEVQHARRTSQNVKRDVRLRLHADHTERTRKRSKKRHTKDGKSRAAVELGRKGGAARARSLTPKKRSALAMKAARVRWNSP
jgi:seryl-tRNA synthetase